MIGFWLRRRAATVLPLRGPPTPPAKKKSSSQTKKTSTTASVPEHLRRFRPFLPPQLVSETTSFLGNSSNVRRLLDIIFGAAREGGSEGPAAGDADPSIGSSARKGCTLSEAELFQERLEEYQLRRAESLRPLLAREAAAAELSWKAIAALPRDLFEEATRSNFCAFPDPPSSSDSAIQQTEASGAKTQRVDSSSGAVASDADALGWEFQSFPAELAFHSLYRSHFMSGGGLNAEERRRLQVFMNLMYLRFPHAEHKETKPHLFWTSEKAAISRDKERALASKKK